MRGNCTTKSNPFVDQSKRSNFTTIPNLIDDLPLSPLAVRLYLHYARWAGAPNKRPLSVSELKAKFRAGTAKIAEAKDELVRHRLILVDDSRRSKGRPDRVKVLDIWHRNAIAATKGVNPSPVTNQQQVDEIEAVCNAIATKGVNPHLNLYRFRSVKLRPTPTQLGTHPNLYRFR